MAVSGDRAPVIFSCEGERLTAEERAFFTGLRPAGFILMGRNCRGPEQIRDLIGELRDCVGDRLTPVLVDQEGGPVQRLRPPAWADLPSPADLGDLYEADPGNGLTAARLHGRIIAGQLAPLGFTVDCAPTLDVRQAQTHHFLVRRVFGNTANSVMALSRAWREGLEDGGVSPAIKHAPGHGRATADSHEALPEVADSDDRLAIDLAPFAAHQDAPWVLTAHIRYPAWDTREPATFSTAVIGGILRRRLGLRGVVVSDDLNMNALGGSLAERAQRALAAGCDLALHCKGDLAEMSEIAMALPTMSAASARRLTAARDYQARLTVARRAEEAAAPAERLAALWRLMGRDAAQ
ncbi:MAG: glycoside hydrolase family 3 N-terminal domain-containing protein [Alphaproteobacteria bacterium]